MKSVRIIGVGSPAGDDQAGWWTIEALDRSALHAHPMAERICTLALDRPGVNLINCMDRAERVFLVDAVQSTAPLGTIYRLNGRALADGQGTLSCHGFGVATALSLAGELGALPKALTLFGIAIGRTAPTQHVSARVYDAAQAVAHEILDELSHSFQSAQPSNEPSVKHICK